MSASRVRGPALCRPMRPSDLDGVLAVQAACYPAAFNEAASVLRARLAAAPDTAWVAERDGVLCAYLVGYRSQRGLVTPLGGDFHPAARPDTLYLHDLAVIPAAAGLGCGSALVARAAATAAHERLEMALVAVGDAQDFWLRQGFRPAATVSDPMQRAHLASYPGGACYMRRAPGNAATEATASFL